MGLVISGSSTPAAGVIVNSMVNASAAIAYSKLNLTGSIVNADINASAAIALSKLATTGTLQCTQVNATGTIATTTGDINAGSGGDVTSRSAATRIALTSDGSRPTINFGATNPVTIRRGAGTPEANVTANVGALYLRDDGGAGTCLYVKESGTGNTGWVAK